MESKCASIHRPGGPDQGRASVPARRQTAAPPEANSLLWRTRLARVLALRCANPMRFRVRPPQFARYTLCLPALLAGALLLVPALRAGSAAPGPDFNREIRPLLAEHCFACHGPDEAARHSKLRLDLPGAALKGIHAPPDLGKGSGKPQRPTPNTAPSCIFFQRAPGALSENGAAPTKSPPPPHSITFKKINAPIENLSYLSLNTKISN